MATSHLVRPELRQHLEGRSLPTLTNDNLQDFRLPLPPLSSLPVTPGLDVSRRTVPASHDQPEVEVLLYRPSQGTSPVPAILHIHGGGFVLGRPEDFDVENRPLAEALGCVIASVDYRLAPETPFPGPLEDCYSALKWLYTNAAELGVDPTRIAVKGESGGGGLAAALAILARDRGEVPVAFQSLSCPMIDDRGTADEHPGASAFTWTAENNRFGWRSYLAQEPGGEGVSPYAAAARAQDLTGVPPAWITTSDLDIFMSEDLEYARRLALSGVSVELVMYAGAYHGFPLAGETEIGRRYYREVREALAAALSI